MSAFADQNHAPSLTCVRLELFLTLFDLATFAAIFPGINEFHHDKRKMTSQWFGQFGQTTSRVTNSISATSKLNGFSIPHPQCKDCCSVAAHQISVIIYDHFFSQRVCKGLYYAFIFTYSTLEYDWSKYFLTFQYYLNNYLLRHCTDRQ